MQWLATSWDKIRQYAFFLFCFTIPLNQFISTRILIVLAIVSLVSFHKQKQFILKNAWDMMLYLLVLLGGLIYSTDMIAGLRVLETSFPLLALPLAAAFLSNEPSNVISTCFKSFVWGAFIACIICLSNAVIIGWQTNLSANFYADGFTSILGFQPLYFAYYLIFGITYCLYTLYHRDLDFSPAMGLTICGVMFLSLLFTGTKTSFISLLLVFSFFILKFLVEEHNKVKVLVLISIVVMLFSMVIMNMININDWNASGDAWERMVLWRSGVKAVPNILLGVGTGDYKQILNEYYRSNQLSEYAEDGMNVHNQMIQILFSNGIFGLLSFMLLIIHPIYRAFRSGNMLALVSLFPFLVYGITEVFLGRYQGVVFWTWMHQVFLNLISAEESKRQSSTM